MWLSGTPQDIQSPHLIADDLIYQGIGSHQYPVDGIVEAVDHPAVFHWIHLFSERHRSPYIDEEQGQLDLSAALVLEGEFVAEVAQIGIHG